MQNAGQNSVSKDFQELGAHHLFFFRNKYTNSNKNSSQTMSDYISSFDDLHSQNKDVGYDIIEIDSILT